MRVLRKLFPKLLSRQYSVRTQLFGIAAIFICIGSFAILMANSQLIPLAYTLRQSYQLQEIGEQVEMLFLKSDNFYSKMSFIEESNNIEVEIYDHNNRLIYDSAVNRLIQDWDNGNGLDLLNALRTRNLTVTSHKELTDDTYLEQLIDKKTNLQYMMYASTISNSNTLKIYSQLDYIETTANSTTHYVSFIAITTFAIIMILLYVYLHHFTKPLVEMNKITRAMAKMDFSQKCKSYNNNEIGELGKSINTLSSSLDKTLHDLQEKNEKLEADIEQERRIEKMRKEFVANASHELKTPIAIIQGYAEGIKLGINSDKAGSDEYCDIIIEETHKMNRLVCEMLELSKYESGAYQLEPCEFDVKKFINDSIDTYSILAAESEIEIIKDIPDNLTAFGDSSKLEMVIHNYVSNALTHAKGAKKIIISATETDLGIKVSVFNTGDHIPEEALPNLWQSFYRADKAHSRAEGHFGIGLSIVKAIQELHGMPYSVENTDGGVTFSFVIKRS